jgi:hypothetical protein
MNPVVVVLKVLFALLTVLTLLHLAGRVTAYAEWQKEKLGQAVTSSGVSIVIGCACILALLALALVGQ